MTDDPVLNKELIILKSQELMARQLLLIDENKSDNNIEEETIYWH